MSLVTEVVVPRYGIAWYPWAVQYFFLIALSYTSLWIAAPGIILGKKHWLATSRLALLACVSTTLVAPVALLADLHQPLRFWHFYAHPTPWSWMSLGSFLLPLHLASTVLLAWLAWRPALKARSQENDGWFSLIAGWIAWGDWQVSRKIMVLVGLAALATSVGMMIYTGAEVAIVKGRPLWHTIWLPPMFVATGIVGACGLILLLNRISGMRQADTNRQMLAIMVGACVVAGFIALTWFLDGANAVSGSVAAALDSIDQSAAWRSTAIEGGIAGVLLAALAFVVRRTPARRKAFGWVLGLLALHVAWMFRWVVLMNVQTVARNSAGFHDYHVAFGSYGLTGIIGIFGLWLTALLLIELFVPWREASLDPQRDAPASNISVSAASQGAPRHG
ncbi:NrfD/PsrC family molybdoenzyme membrane anchor subunit [Vreelandella subglaciescola]|uniref:Tetrathionate reductase gamma subunit n=1 Tax=Vreelandella subglaciescola TaxID=29571 RepID=A0A1M7FQ84_9GAMM|nr:NrfD/PsrC family molybdoenzyme membrane anchor subunit [Halomonas subglaciescola]SHM05827.1 tetrathionate reductase gamma subunit [Halomonas subglaciescola]